MLNPVRRIIFYGYHDQDGKLRDFARDTVSSLSQVCDRLVVVVRGNLNKEGIYFFEENCAEILFERGSESDFHACKAGILSLGLEMLQKFDQLVICSSDVYGPLTSLNSLFEEMERRGADLWGLWKCHPDNDPKAEDIEKDFVVFNKNVLVSEAFFNFLSDAPSGKDDNRAVLIYFSKKGFFCDAFIRSDVFSERHSDSCRMRPDEMLRLGIPFIKREVFADKKLFDDQLKCSFGLQTKGMIDELRNRISFDLSSIYSDVCETKTQSEIKNHFGNTFVLPTAYEKPSNVCYEAIPGKTALILFVYFEDLVTECAGYIRSVPKDIDIYLISCRKSILSRYKEILEDLHLKITYRVQENRGRSESAYFITCKDVLLKYDYICCLHDKKMVHASGLLGESMMKHNFDSLVASGSYIKNIIKLLYEEPFIGLLMPATPFFMKTYEKLSNDTLGINREIYMQVAKKLKISCPIDPNPVFPVGGMFWIKGAAIKNFYNYDWKIEDFPKEPLPKDGALNHVLERIIPLVVQNSGHMSAYVIPDVLAGSYYEAMEFRIRELIYKNNKNQLFEFSKRHGGQRHFFRNNLPVFSRAAHLIRDAIRKAKAF